MKKNQQTKEQLVALPTAPKIQYLQIELGAPSKECINFGICRVTMLSEESWLRTTKSKCCQVKAIAQNWEGLLAIFFWKLSLSPKAFHKHFWSGQFIIEEPTPLPPNLLKALDFSQNCVIETGAYPIEERGDWLVIRF